MNCTACGKDNAATVSFCEFCGVDLRPKTVPSGGSVQSTGPSAADVVQVGRSLINSFTVGERFAVGGVVGAVLGFFLPFISAPDLGSLSGLLGAASGAASELSHASFSLLELSRLLGAIYFILLAAIGSGVLFYFSRTAGYRQKMLINGFQVMIGSLFGPGNILALLFVPMIQSVAGLGYWLVGLGFCSIAAGGLITIGQLAKSRS
jgi:hypothetical protein